MNGPEGIDRRFYEFCALAELKNALRSGDVFVAGSRQFRDFEDYLMPRLDFDRRLKQGMLRVAVPTATAAYLEERLSLLRKMLDQTNALALSGQLPDVELSSSTGLKISPLEHGYYCPTPRKGKIRMTGRRKFRGMVAVGPPNQSFASHP